jgi:PAS domain S-box-containing protein
MSHDTGSTAPQLRSSDEEAGDPSPLQQLAEGLGAVAWELDAEAGRLTHLSGNASHVLGYPRARWLEEPRFLETLLMRDADHAALREVRSEQSGRTVLLALRDAGGRHRWMRTRLERVGDAGGSRLRGLMIDITPEREAAERLGAEVQRSALAAAVGSTLNEGGTLDTLLQRVVETLVESLHAAFGRVWILDESGSTLILRASAGLYTHLDGEHGAVPVGKYKIGMIAEERSPHLTNDVQNDPRVSNREWARREGMVAFAGYPLMVEDRLLGVLAIFSRDPLSEATLHSLQAVSERLAMVVDQRLAHERLRERETQLAEAQRIARVGSWEWHPGEQEMKWSDEMYRLHGLRPGSGSIRLDEYLARLHPGDAPAVRSKLERLAREGGAFEFEERVVLADGGVRILASRARAGRLHGDSRTVVFGTSQDVTESRAAAARERDLEREQTLRRVAQEQERRMTMLAEVSRALAASLDYETTLRNVAFAVVPEMADWCAIDVIAEDGRPQRVVTAHPDPAKQLLAQRLAERYPTPDDAPHGLPNVLRTGRSELVPTIPAALLEASAQNEEHLRILRELDLRSYMVVPLIARERVLGAITLIRAESGGEYDLADLGFAEELAQRAAIAIDNSRLFQEAEHARAHTARILASISDAFFSLDREWRFSYVNDQAEHVLARTREELLGSVIWDQFPEAVGSLFQEKYEQAVRENRTIQFEEFYPPLDAWYEVRAYPSPDGLSVYFHDITQKRLAQDEVREREAQFRFLADTIPQQIWITRPDGYHEYYSQRWYDYTGTTEEEAKGAGWENLLHPDDLERAQQRWTHSLRTGEPYSIEYRFRRASDGQLPVVSRTGAPATRPQR